MEMKFIIGLTLFISSFSNQVYGQDSWKIDSTRVVFHISNAGLKVDGTIRGIVADIKFSKNKVSKSVITATANSGTIATGIKLRDKHLKKPDYFDSNKFPIIKIESNQITKSKDGFESLSSITIKGITREITIPFTFNQTKNKAEFKGIFSLNRLDFGIGEKSIILSETVEVEVWIGASLQNN